MARRWRMRHMWAKVALLRAILRHPRTPWQAKALAAAVVGYALSPIDLIPDFIPFAGVLDDMVIVPLGMAVVERMVPADVLRECKVRDEQVLVQG